MEELAIQALKFNDSEASLLLLSRFPVTKTEGGDWILTSLVTERNMRDLLNLTPLLQVYPKSDIVNALKSVHLAFFDTKLPSWAVVKSAYFRQAIAQFNKWQAMQQATVDWLLRKVAEGSNHEEAVGLVRCCRGRQLIEGVKKMAAQEAARKDAVKEQMRTVIHVVLEAVKGAITEQDYIEQALVFEQYYLEREDFDPKTSHYEVIPWLTLKLLVTYFSKFKQHTLLKPYFSFLLIPFLKIQSEHDLISLVRLTSSHISSHESSYTLISILSSISSLSQSDDMFAISSSTVKRLTAIDDCRMTGVVRWMMRKIVNQWRIDVEVDGAVDDGWQWMWRCKNTIDRVDDVDVINDNDDDDDHDDGLDGFDCLEGNEEETDYKHLYQCLLAFQSDDPNRIITSLKSLPAAIINNISYLPSIAGDLIKSLLLLNHPIDGFSTKKSRALLFLLLCAPSSFKDLFMARFFKGDCSLGERISLLHTMNTAVWRIMTNANDRNIVRSVIESSSAIDFDGGPDSTSTSCLKQRPLIQIVGEDQSEQDRVKEIKDKKVEQQSRRWGYARKAREAQLAEDSSKLKAFMIVETTFEDKVVAHLTPLYLVVFTDLMEYAK